MKGELEEFDVSEVSRPLLKAVMAVIHAMMASLSLDEEDETYSYFDGEMTDRRAPMRIFGFD